jgi:hypothetical protein
MAGQDLEQRTEHEADHSFVLLLGEVDDVEIEVVVPYSVDADGHVISGAPSWRALSMIVRLCATLAARCH